ncbi:MAG: hypothetical protein AABM41_06130 [Chloroflexota bacterium]
MEGPQPESAALRDARAIATRVTEDEAASDEARRRYQTDGLPVVEPEAGFAPLALPGEVLHASRENALLERTLIDAPEPLPQAGTLYLSSERLVHVGTDATSIPLGEIEEMAVALERLLLVRLHDGTHLAIDTDRPRLLRVQIAAALVATRVGEAAEQGIAASGQPASQPAG